MKLTPLNIVLACFLAWAAAEWGKEGQPAWWSVLLLAVLLLLVDLVFRMLLKDLKRLWISELCFVLLAGFLLLLIRTTL